MVDFSVSNPTSTDDVVFLNIKEIKQVLLGHMPFLRSQLSTVFFDRFSLSLCAVWLFGLVWTAPTLYSRCAYLGVYDVYDCVFDGCCLLAAVGKEVSPF